MPQLSCWLVRAALLNLLLGGAIGAALLWDLGLPYGSWAWRLLALHRETLLFGWLAQATMGVASWILPRQDSARGPSGGSLPLAWRTALGWTALALLNVGVATAALGGWLAMGTLEGGGKALEALSATAFIIHAWSRVRGIVPEAGIQGSSGRRPSNSTRPP